MVGSGGMSRLSKRDCARARWCGQVRRASPGRVQLWQADVRVYGKETDAHAVDGDPVVRIVVLCLGSLSYAAPGGVVSAVLARREVDGKQQRERSLSPRE